MAEIELPKQRYYRRAGFWAVLMIATLVAMLLSIVVIVVIVGEGLIDIIWINLAVLATSPRPGPPPSWFEPPITVAAATLAISTLALMVTVLGTASTVMLGWRDDKRQTAETKLKIEQLERQLAEAKVEMPKKLDTAL
jgi:hypothetical protein